MIHRSKAVIAIVVLPVAVTILAASMWVFGWGAFQRSTADYRGKTGEVEKVQADPDYRIAAYEKFYDLCASVQADEANLRDLAAQLDAPADALRKNEIRTTISAVRAHRAETIATYNADARKTGTAAQFRASDLPAQLDPSKENTTCTAK